MRIKLITALLIVVCIVANAQNYHYKTKKIIPVNTPDTILWTSGVFNYHYAYYGTLVVKENRQDRKSKLLNIPVIRIKSYSKDSPAYPIFILNGGPGETNINPKLINNKLLKYHDFVFVGYRGVDGSVKLNYPLYSNQLFTHTSGEETFGSNVINNVDSFFISCKEQGTDILGYTMDEVVSDIKAVKESLKYSKISFLSFSYGTMLAQRYCQKYGSSDVEKIVCIGARPVADFHFYDDILSHQLKLIYSYYFNDTNQPELKNITDFVETEMFSKKLFIYLFSQLYTSQSIHKIFSLFIDAVKNNSTQKIYCEMDKFYENYPGELMLGDLYSKKQGCLNPTETDTSTLIKSMCKTLNSYYNPCHKFLLSKDEYSLYDTIKTPMLLISGELDVAAPPKLVEQKIVPLCKKSEHIIINMAGHLNLLTDKKNKTDSLIEYFFIQTEID